MSEKTTAYPGKSVLSPIDYVLCAVLALAFAASPYYISWGECSFSLAFCLSAFALFPALLLCAWLTRSVMAKGSSLFLCRGPISRFFERVMQRPHHILLLGLMIFLCWLPVLFFVYPGTIINDTWVELREYICMLNGTGGLSDHHPVFDTLLFGTAIVPLSRLTGRWQLVFFLFVLVQAAITALVFSYTIDYAFHRLAVGPIVALSAFLSYCFLPLYPLSVQTVSKDAIFGWIYVLFVVQLIEFVRTEGSSLDGKKARLLFTITMLFCCLTKKVGFYVVFFSYGIAWLVLRRKSPHLLTPLLVSLLVMKLVLPLAFSALHIAPGGKQEMFSLPFQMTARYTLDHGDDITPAEYDVLSRVLKMDTITEDYDPTFADPIKQYSQRGEDADYLRYLAVWLRQGLRHPDSYWTAANAMLSGWFSWSQYDPLISMEFRDELSKELIPEWVNVRGASEATANAFQEYYIDAYNNPLFRLFLSYGFYASLVPAFAVGTVFKKNLRKSHAWLALLPTLFSLALGCWLAPASIFLEGRRYLYPLTYTTPLVLMWCLYTLRHAPAKDAPAAEA